MAGEPRLLNTLVTRVESRPLFRCARCVLVSVNAQAVFARAICIVCHMRWSSRGLLLCLVLNQVDVVPPTRRLLRVNEWPTRRLLR